MHLLPSAFHRKLPFTTSALCLRTLPRKGGNSHRQASTQRHRGARGRAEQVRGSRNCALEVMVKCACVRKHFTQVGLSMQIVTAQDSLRSKRCNLPNPLYDYILAEIMHIPAGHGARRIAFCGITHPTKLCILFAACND